MSTQRKLKTVKIKMPSTYKWGEINTITITAVIAVVVAADTIRQND